MKKLLSKGTSLSAAGLLITGAIFGGIVAMTNSASADTPVVAPTTTTVAPDMNDPADANDANEANDPADANDANDPADATK